MTIGNTGPDQDEYSECYDVRSNLLLGKLLFHMFTYEEYECETSQKRK